MSNFLEPGTRVRYVPGHAQGDHDHPDCESGIIASVKGETVFVQFDKDVSAIGHDASAKPCDRYDLHALPSDADELRAEVARLKEEIATLQFAAHMPDDYQYGLPSWICQRLYAAYIHQARNKGEWEALKRALDQRDALLSTLKENHEWHISYDDHNTYKDSELYDKNVAAIKKAEELPG